MKSWVKILLGLVLGILAGLVLGQLGWIDTIELLGLFGKVFINLLTMLVVLIVFSSLVVGICHIGDPKRLGRIGFRTLMFYILTTMIAVCIGIVVAYLLKPGVGLSLSLSSVSVGPESQLTITDMLVNLIPSNPFNAFSEGNILQVIIFAVFLAIAIIFTKDAARPLLTLLESVANTMHTLTHFVMLLAPYGIFALMASTVGVVGLKILLPLMNFLLCTYIACFIQLFLIFGVCIRGIAKMRLIPFYKGMKDAIVLAFTTSSSTATLPVSMECAQKHLGISEDISSFVLSLGSTINMNGASIGQAVSAIFIAQAYGIELSILQLGTLVVVSIFSAIGAAGIPGTGIVMLSLVLGVMGLPLEGIALVAGVDRLREMVSSVVNVMGDAAATIVVAKKEEEIDEDVYNSATWTQSEI